MAKVDLVSREWCELIFQNRNKSYGAYKMRSDLGRRQTAALIIVAVVAVVGFSAPKLIKMAMPEKKEVMTEVTQLSALEEPEVKQQEEIVKPIEPVAPPPKLKSTIKFTPPVIKKDEEVPDDEQLRSQDELAETKLQISIADVKGNDELNGADIADLQETITQAPVEEEKPYVHVEQMPEFPGGQQALLQYIAKELKYPVIAQENGIEGMVVVQFVVKADGHVGDIKVVRSLDPYCDKEAIRVVQTLPQWTPGMQNGRAVPVYYTLPIRFKLQ
ncbi:MAG TPA: energy transducer TonB [Candidatus Avibacteroides faecavium]|nr:energy transducer TonB [Candidatus Avibacteroides faecavium]